MPCNISDNFSCRFLITGSRSARHAREQAGAVAGVHTLRNPVSAARMVMEQSPHVLMVGDGAEQFAVSRGARTEPPAYFHTERRWQQLQTLLAEEAAASASGITPASLGAFIALDHNVAVGGGGVGVGGSGADPSANSNASSAPSDAFPVDHKSKFGTVGAVALDAHGNVAAATSTGGMSNKRWGRVGDSPIIGAGTYANNRTCAVSATGHGEYFIRNVVAFRVAALMEFGGFSVQAAAEKVVHETLKLDGGEGGIIAMDAHGNVSMPFNSEGMYRGCIDADGQCAIAIFGDGK